MSGEFRLALRFRHEEVFVIDTRRVTVWMWLALISVVVVGQESAKLSTAEAKTVVQDFCFGNVKASNAARKRLEAVRAQDRKDVFAAFESATFKQLSTTPISGRRMDAEMSAPESTVKMGKCVVVIPAKYNPSKSWPMVFRFHGPGADCETFSKGWESMKAAEDCIAVFPEIPSKDRLSWTEPGSIQHVKRMFDFVLRQLNVDTDRVYFTGHSVGCGAALALAGIWPERVAGLYGSAHLQFAFASEPKLSMEVIKSVPCVFAVGLKDADARIQSFRDAEAFAKETSAPWTFHFVPKRGHEPFPELDKPAFELLLKSKRTRYPREFSTLFFSNVGSDANDHFKSQNWLRATKCDTVRGTFCKVSVKDNVVTIDAPRLEAGVLLLNDELVNLDEPVVVMLDGKEVKRVVVPRSVKFLLDGYDEFPDRRRLFWNALDFKR